MSEISTVLAIGATGSIGRHVVDALLDRGVRVRALVRSVERARGTLPDAVDLVHGDMTEPATLGHAVAGVDGIVFTHGGDPESVDYQGVLNVIDAIGDARPRVVLMSSLATSRGGDVFGGVLEWRRRAERLVRASGLPATVVRPGWFDNQGPDHTGVALEQGDASDFMSRRGVGREQIATVLVEALLTDAATGRTLELFAQPGSMPQDWPAAFAALDADDPTTLAGAHDQGVALEDEPAHVREDLARLQNR